MDAKQCSKCSQVKLLSEFSPSSRGLYGRHSRCKACINEIIKARYRENPEVRDRCRKYAKEHAGTPAGRAAQHKCQKKYRPTYLSDPENQLKVHARTAISNALLLGKIRKPLSCQCGGKYGAVCEGRIEAHHHKGYSQEHWLDVEWLSAVCHKAADALQVKEQQCQG